MSRLPDGLHTAINKLAGFLALRDVSALSREALQAACRIESADLLILLGSSLLPAAETAARAYADGLASQFMIAGGIGHSTPLLREAVRRNARYRAIAVEGKSEAEILAEVVAEEGWVSRDRMMLEKASTNCGNNATFALEEAKKRGRLPQSVMLIQDPTMQRRTAASFRKAWAEAGVPVRFISFAPFIPKVKLQAGELAFDTAVQPGRLWTMDRFVSLLMGEIPRLMDNENGYGPAGKNFIDHVDVPADVLAAYERLLPHFGGRVRPA